MSAKILKAVPSSVFLPDQGELRRLPRAPKRHRPQKFWDGFEDRALVYDVFWHLDGSQVLLVCPPPMNLEEHWLKASFKAMPSGKVIQPKIHNIRSSMTIALQDVALGQTHIEITFAGQKFMAEIMPNLADEFDGSCVMFTMSQNNPLSWIAEWARYHQSMHGVDAIIFFDNGSSVYKPEDIEKTLAEVPGIKKVLVMSIPYRYGPHDPGVIFHRFWANFLQVSTFSMVLRRFAGKAFGLLNVDIDELAAPVSGGDVFKMAHESIDGLYRMRGNWVESVVESGVTDPMPSHPAFRMVRKDFRHKLNAKKWALDPSRNWLADLDMHPSVHRIMNMPKPMHKRAPMGLFWHFKGINTNWKEKRNRSNRLNSLTHHRPAELQNMFAKFLQACTKQDNKDK